VTGAGLDEAAVRAMARTCCDAGRRLRWRIPVGTPPSLAPRVSDLARAEGGAECAFVCDPGPLAIARVRRLAEALADRSDPIVLEAPALGAAAPVIAGALLCDGIGDALCLTDFHPGTAWPPGGVAWSEDPVASTYAILQACRVRLTRAEFIACPSCGRTQFDLQSTTARIRSRTEHLIGVKIAIMGCIVNGPGEMADADFGYVGSGPGKVDLYVGRERVEKSVPEADAPDRLIRLLRAHGAWSEPPPHATHSA
jgi:(E)-4-hydroxy-3-methylbut-2-enyl-diphosphate synthase